MSLLLAISSVRRILTFRTTSQKVSQAEARLEQLRKENEVLKSELEYKKSDEFAESEIRNKLGLAKKDEAIVVVPKKDDDSQSTIDDRQSKVPNYIKWWNLFFGS